MSKGAKKKDKVPKITEAEYAAYLSALRGETEKAAQPLQVQPKPISEKK